MKRLFGTVISHLSTICSVLMIVSGLVGLWYAFWPGIITSVLGVVSLILQYLDEKKHESEMTLINTRLQLGDIVAQEIFDKPYYGGLVAKQYYSAPVTRIPMKLLAPPVKRRA